MSLPTYIVVLQDFSIIRIVNSPRVPLTTTCARIFSGLDGNLGADE